MKPLADAINASGIPSEVSDTIEEALWAKMLFNTTLNPLGAILGTTYGAMSEMNNAVQIMNSLIGETYNVMGAAGYKTYWPDADTYKKVFYSKLVPDTYAHRSSTLQDMEKEYLRKLIHLTDVLSELQIIILSKCLYIEQYIIL